MEYSASGSPSIDGLIQIKPSKLPGELILRARQETLRLKVGVAVPAIPNAPPKVRKVLVSSPVIEMLVDLSTSAVEFAPDRPEQSLTINEHRDVNAWTRLVTSEVGAKVEVRIKHKHAFSGHFSSAPGKADLANMRRMQDFLRGLHRLLRHSGALEVRFSREEMGPQLQSISLMSHLCLPTGPDRHLSFNATTVQPLAIKPEPSEILILAHITLGGVDISLAAVGTATITGDAHTKLIEVMDIGVREIDRLSDGRSEFSERMRAETGLALVLEVGGSVGAGRLSR